MRIQIASDLHVETLHRCRHLPTIAPAFDAEMLILAGDIATHTHGIKAFEHWPVPVLYVHGNHEPGRAHYWGLIKELARVAQGTCVRYLECASVEMSALRILGCCLWTDYALDGARLAAMQEAARSMPEHKTVRVSHGQPFLPSHALAEHQKSRQWLREELDRPYAGKTVVVTHHAPHPLSIHPMFHGDVLNAAFASDLTPLVEKAHLWIHGHLHQSSNYEVGRCRVICNPRGYPRNPNADSAEDVRFENEAFDPALVVEI
ncbi:metallophosphoesterase family protein [Paraburkholderia youngii]